MLLSTSCAHLDGKLGRWAVAKGMRLGACMTLESEGHEHWTRDRALECLGDFAVDRNTPACTEAVQWVAQHPEVN